MNEKERATIKSSGKDDRVVEKFIVWFLKRYYKEDLERLKGDDEKIDFTEVTFRAHEYPEIEYYTHD